MFKNARAMSLCEAGVGRGRVFSAGAKILKYAFELELLLDDRTGPEEAFASAERWFARFSRRPGLEVSPAFEPPLDLLF